MANCSKCGRKLTHPLSIAAGMGPECAGVGSWPTPKKAHQHGEQLGMFADEESPCSTEEGVMEMHEAPRDQADFPPEAPGRP